MRKLIVSEFISLDGVMEAPGGEPGYKHTGWVHRVRPARSSDQYKLDEVLEAEALLLGRVTYEGFAEAWPPRSDEAGFADKMNSMPKYVVVDDAARELEWNNSTAARGRRRRRRSRSSRRATAAPCSSPGSRTLVHTLIEHDLVDEYRLMVFPVVLGSGKRLFPDGIADKIDLEPVDTQSFASGVAVHTYRAKRGG